MPSLSVLEKETENVKAYLNVFQQHKVFDCEPSNGDGVTVVKPLKHFVSGEASDSRLREDMLSFRQIGLTSYKNYVDYQFLSTPSTSVVRRQKKKLKTFGETTAKKKQKINLAEKQRKLVHTCIKKALAYSLVQGLQLQAGTCQFLDLPKALADAGGISCKGVKTDTTAVIARRYPGVIETLINSMTPPDVVVLDGMFYVQPSPLKLPFMKTFQEYSRVLFCTWIVAYFEISCNKENTCCL